MNFFKPVLSILPPPQRKLWPELNATPPDFTLYGGTALALRLGHRFSVDFDFFSNDPFDVDDLSRRVPYLEKAERLQVGPSTLVCRVDRDGPVLLSFFGNLSFGMVNAPEKPEEHAFAVASLLDIAAAKLSVIQKRAEVKDYIDIESLLESGLTMPSMLAAAVAIYGPSFNPLVSLKALSYFGDVPSLPEASQNRLREIARKTSTEDLLLPKLYKPGRVKG